MYIDPYSIRDEQINHDLIQINDLLGHEKINKTKINKKIEEYTSEIEKGEEKRMWAVGVKAVQEQLERDKIIEKLNIENSYEMEEDEKLNEKRYFREKTLSSYSKDDLKPGATKKLSGYEMFKLFKEQVLEKNAK